MALYGPESGGRKGPYWRRQLGITLPGERTGQELAAVNAQRARLGLPPLGGPAQIGPMPGRPRRPGFPGRSGIFPGEGPGGMLPPGLGGGPIPPPTDVFPAFPGRGPLPPIRPLPPFPAGGFPPPVFRGGPLLTPQMPPLRRAAPPPNPYASSAQGPMMRPPVSYQAQNVYGHQPRIPPRFRQRVSRAPVPRLGGPVL
jgi:hypothetical protein